jgi:hypothetical protein
VELNGAHLARQPSFAGKINKRDFAVAVSVGAESLRGKIREGGTRPRDNDRGKKERGPLPSNRTSLAHGARLVEALAERFGRRTGQDRVD